MANCITNFAYIAAGTKQAAAITAQAAADIAIQVGIALWQRNSSQSISNMQTNLANQQVELAEEVHAHAVLFWPAEAALVNDIFSIARVTATYTALGSGWGNIAVETFEAGRQVWIEAQRQNCMAPTPCENARWQRNAMSGRVDLGSYGYRQAEARMEILNDRRYARQLDVLGLGRGRVNTLTSYQSVSQFSGLSASGMLEAGIQSALKTYNYYSDYRQPDGWASGIRQTWSAARMPAPAQVEKNAWDGKQFGAMERTAPTALPMPVPVQAPRRTGKEAESDWAFNPDGSINREAF